MPLAMMAVRSSKCFEKLVPHILTYVCLFLGQLLTYDPLSPHTKALCMNGSKGSIFVAFCENRWITSQQELLTLDSCIVELRKHDLTDFCRAPLHLCTRAVFAKLTMFKTSQCLGTL